MSNYQFSNSWFAHNIANWESIQTQKNWFGKQPISVIEIGCFEGQASCWIINNLLFHSESQLYCLDTFAGSEEHSEEERENLYQRFQHNIYQTNRAHQVDVRVGLSEDGLISLINEQVRADLIYIDGSHKAQDVLTDAVLAWKLLKVGGVMIFDDYLWRLPQDQYGIHSNPKLAIDSFVNIFYKNINFIHGLSNHQFYIQKVAPREPSTVKGISSNITHENLVDLKPKEPNYIVCPDWSQPDEILLTDLEKVLAKVTQNFGHKKINLLIYLDDIDFETGDLIVSTSAMNFLMKNDCDITNGPSISLVSRLSDSEWKTVLSKLMGRLQLEHENYPFIKTQLSELSSYCLEAFTEIELTET
jgi:predicted O-methyltransferase YrrM